MVCERVNPSNNKKMIRRDDVEELQEISSQNKYDFNQRIAQSPHERVFFINEKFSLTDYAAFYDELF